MWPKWLVSKKVTNLIYQCLANVLMPSPDYIIL